MKIPNHEEWAAASADLRSLEAAYGEVCGDVDEEDFGSEPEDELGLDDVEKGDPGPRPGDYPEFDQTGDPVGPMAA